MLKCLPLSAPGRGGIAFVGGVKTLIIVSSLNAAPKMDTTLDFSHRLLHTDLRQHCHGKASASKRKVQTKGRALKAKR